MLNPDRFPGNLFRSRKSSSWRSASRALGASAGVLVVALAVCLSVHHAPYAAASDSGPLAMNIVRSATDLNWRQSPHSVLSSPGRNSVTLDPCPPGVFAAERWYYVYISGTGSPEAVRVTGGTCKGDSRPGTLEFTTANSHPSGYVVEQRVKRYPGSFHRGAFHSHQPHGNPAVRQGRDSSGRVRRLRSHFDSRLQPDARFRGIGAQLLYA